MRSPSQQELRSLATEGHGPHISLVLPVETAGRETRQNAIRLKNLLRQAEDDTVTLGFRRTDVQALLQSAWQAEQEAPFWQEREPGLALYVAPGFYRSYWLPNADADLVMVAGRFYLKPLIEMASNSQAFFVLAISMNDARFFRCTRFSDQELAVEGLPRGMAEALWPDDPERQQQFRNQPVAQASGKQGTFGVFHGSGDIVEDETKDRILRYFQQVDKALQKVLSTSRLPLILASVDYLHSIYAEANSYRYLVREGIHGNPENVRAEELRQKAWKLLEPRFAESQRALLERYNTLRPRGRAVAGIKEVVRAAEAGRVESLLYKAGAHVWGVRLRNDIAFSPEKRPGDEDIIDYAMVQTFLKDGDLCALAQEEENLPDQSVMKAILRF
jgi:hypothetical protein